MESVLLMDKTVNRQNVKLTKQRVDKKASWWAIMLEKEQVDKMKLRHLIDPFMRRSILGKKNKLLSLNICKVQIHFSSLLYLFHLFLPFLSFCRYYLPFLFLSFFLSHPFNSLLFFLFLLLLLLPLFSLSLLLSSLSHCYLSSSFFSFFFCSIYSFSSFFLLSVFLFFLFIFSLLPLPFVFLSHTFNSLSSSIFILFL